MANVILPIVWTHFLSLGGTMNMMNYDESGDNYEGVPRIFRDVDFVKIEHPPVLNASYYILQDDRLPYDAMRLPVDLLFRLEKRHLHPVYIKYHTPLFLWDNPLHYVAALMMIAEFTTGKEMINPYAKPVPGWQEFIPKNATHYAEEVTIGGKCFAKVELRTAVKGDVQIIKRILTEAMGTSGHFTNKDIPAFKELWKFALNAVKESPDIRGRRVYVSSFRVLCQDIQIPFEVERHFENFLAYLPNISLPHFEGHPIQGSLSVSLKPLHSLDDRYPPMEINKQTEEYLTSLHIKLEDLKKVFMKGYRIPRPEEDKKLKEELWSKVNDLRKKLRELIPEEISIYKEIDVEKFDDVFQQYAAGLDKGDKNYISAYEKILENIHTKCSDRFRKPTPGVLLATEDEVASIENVKKSLQSCEKFCSKQKRCRAIGYDEKNPQMCRIYNVSTNTADIFYTEEDDSKKIYDRSCEENLG